MSYHDALARVIDEVVAPGAAEVDAAGIFPRRQIEALAGAGLLGLTVPAEFSGGGEGLRAASHVVRELGAVCGSTAMVVTMHYSATAALAAGGMKETLAEIGAGQHLSTLAFSETGRLPAARAGRRRVRLLRREGRDRCPRLPALTGSASMMAAICSWSTRTRRSSGGGSRHGARW